MNPWLIHPAWQSHASLFRECTQATEENSEFLKYHHLTSALYYSITFVEAILNEQMRLKMQKEGNSEDEIHEVLRSPKGGFKKKFTDWPTLISGKAITPDVKLRNSLLGYNEIRGNLTHPKTRGHEVYKELETLDPSNLFLGVTRYGVDLLAALDCEFPYWYFGWNYVTLDRDDSAHFQINNQQFLHSLEYFGLKTNAYIAPQSERWRREYMKSRTGFETIRKAMTNFPDCEPADDDFPMKPRLCRKWWDLNYCRNCEVAPKASFQPWGWGTQVISGLIVALKHGKGKEDEDESSSNQKKPSR